jgi:hypothetical protein
VITLRRTTGFLALAACVAAVGCGGDDEGEPIPANIGGQLQTRLDEIERRFDFGGGACADIEDDSRPAVEQLVASVPDDVDADVREALRDSFDRLFELSAEQCEEEQTETQPEPEPTETEPPPEPIETEPPPETEETEPPPETTETEPPPDQTETEPEQPPPGQGGDAPGGGEGGQGQGGQGGRGQGGRGQGGGPGGSQGGANLDGDAGGALVPEDEG